MATWVQMIPVIPFDRRPRAGWRKVCVAVSSLAGVSFSLTGSGQAAPPAAAPITAPAAAPTTAQPAAPTAAPKAGRAAAAKLAGCLTSGDGYLRAHLAGAIEANVDWPNSGTRCEGESRDSPPGVRLSFRRIHGDKTDLLFVFGITGVREGKPAHEAGTNLTVIVQGANRIFGTMGDSRCTVDSLTQQPLDEPGAYRVEARGFCTQPAHAVLGAGAVLVSTFEFAGPVNYDAHND